MTPSEDLPEAVIAFSAHDHSHCADDILARAQSVVEGKGGRLTPVRRRSLEILLEAHRAMGAYEVLDRLAESGFRSQPPVAYRALEFLVENGLAHRIQRLNAFAACLHPGEEHEALFLICRSCGTVAEATAVAVRSEIDRAASHAGFHVERASMEALGICPRCVRDAT